MSGPALPDILSDWLVNLLGELAHLVSDFVRFYRNNVDGGEGALLSSREAVRKAFSDLAMGGRAGGRRAGHLPTCATDKTNPSSF